MRLIRFTLLALWVCSGTACLQVIDHYSGRSEACAILAVGVPAQASIVQLIDTGTTINDDPVVEFVLDVDLGQGERMQARSRGLVSRLDVAALQPGRVVPVRYDPADRSRVALALWECPRD